MTKGYDELSKLKTLEERFEYLKMGGSVGQETFGYDRFLNQAFYSTTRWKRIRRDIILRDDGNELGLDGFPIKGRIIIHHIEPVSESDILSLSGLLVDPNNLICVSHTMHNAIHYGNADMIPRDPVERFQNDMCPWRK